MLSGKMYFYTIKKCKKIVIKIDCVNTIRKNEGQDNVCFRFGILAGEVVCIIF